MSKRAQKLVDRGYRRVSNTHKHLSRIDRPDWREHMAITHSPWSIDEGMAWVHCLGSGAADHYRRCHSGDVITVTEKTYRMVPQSNFDPVGYIKVSVKRKQRKSRVLKPKDKSLVRTFNDFIKCKVGILKCSGFGTLPDGSGCPGCDSCTTVDGFI